jgi:hypothetical protein
MSETPSILDATCGGRSIWLEKHKENDDTLYVDRRQEESEFIKDGDVYDKYSLSYGVSPDLLVDNRQLPFDADTFSLAIFAPPYILRQDGMRQLNGIMTKKYGALTAETWQSDINDAVCELFRVLTSAGTLVFKFADVHTEWTDVLDVLPVSPLCGTTTKKTSNQETRWFVLHASQYQEETND